MINGILKKKQKKVASIKFLRLLWASEKEEEENEEGHETRKDDKLFFAFVVINSFCTNIFSLRIRQCCLALNVYV